MSIESEKMLDYVDAGVPCVECGLTAAESDGRGGLCDFHSRIYGLRAGGACSEFGFAAESAVMRQHYLRPGGSYLGRRFPSQRMDISPRPGLRKSHG